MRDQDSFDDRIQGYYGVDFDESQRLARPAGVLELTRVQDIVRPLLDPGSHVVDIGGGAGVHARWLAAEGHRVSLVDPVARHVEAARQLPGVRAFLGDARSLDLPDASCDAALLFGPLYHLAERRDRVLALGEAARVVRAGGVVCAAVITRWGAYADAATQQPDGAVLPPWLHELLDTGVAHPGGFFPGAHFHTSAELDAEMRAAGLEVLRLEAIEGPAGVPLELAGQVDEQTWQAALQVARSLGALPGVREMTPHLMGVARVP